MPFSEIVGQTIAVAQLQQTLATDNLPHALLLVGPASVGKTCIARALAATLLSAETWPGGLDAHADFWCEDSDDERISIDRIRAGGGNQEKGLSLQEFFALRGYASDRRVAVIARAERLTEQAANCLLKTLEEPPADGHIVVCTSHPQRLPATVVSRCQAFVCTPPTTRELIQWLHDGRGIDREIAELAARLSAGLPGDALRIAGDAGIRRTTMGYLDALIAVAGHSPAHVVQAADKLAPGAGAEGREQALQQMATWMSFLRDVAYLASGCPELVVWVNYRSVLEEWAGALQLPRVIALLQHMVDCSEQLLNYAQPRLAYEVLFLDIFASHPAPPRHINNGVAPLPVAQ